MDAIEFAFLLIVLVPATVVAAIVLVLVTLLATRRRTERGHLILSSLALPFAWVGWFALVVALAYVSNHVLYDRVGVDVEGIWGDASIGYGHRIEYWTGWGPMYTINPEKGDGLGDPVVFDMRRAQIWGPYVLADTFWSDYVLFDMRSHKEQRFKSEADLARAVKPLGITVKLERASEVYVRYHDTWIDLAFPWVGLGGILLSLGWHFRCMLRQRLTARETA